MLKKLLAPSLMMLMLASSISCVVRSRPGPGRRCPYPYTWDFNLGRCVNRNRRAELIIPTQGTSVDPPVFVAGR